jgi:hypothetical protein
MLMQNRDNVNHLLPTPFATDTISRTISRGFKVEACPAALAMPPLKWLNR